MKKSFFVKIAALILTFALLLTVSVLLVAALDAGEEVYDDSSLVPESDITEEEAPASQLSLEDKFGKYNSVTEEDGKSVVSIYTDEQLAELEARKADGEWLSLTTEEILFIVDNTKELFEKYDVVRIGGKDHYGYSLYRDGSVYDDLTASCDPFEDVYGVISERIRALHSATVDKQNLGSNGSVFVLIGVEADVDWRLDFTAKAIYERWHMEDMERCNSWFEEFVAGRHFSALVFNNHREIYFVPDVSSDDYSTKCSVMTASMLPEDLKLYKYGTSDKSVVIELYKQDDRSLVARIQLDCENAPDKLAQIEALWQDFGDDDLSPATAEEFRQLSGYLAKVYLSGMGCFGGKDESTGISNFVYRPDGDIDRFNFAADCNSWFEISGQIHGIAPITECINEIIADYLK